MVNLLPSQIKFGHNWLESMNRVSTGCILFDNVLTSSYDIKDTAIYFEDSDMIAWGDPWHKGETGA